MSGDFGMTPALRCGGGSRLLGIGEVNATTQHKQRKAKPVAAMWEEKFGYVLDSVLHDPLKGERTWNSERELAFSLGDKIQSRGFSIKLVVTVLVC